MSEGGQVAEPGYREGDVVAGRFRVEAVLGKGGMGTVYRATHLTMGRPVALKVMIPRKGQKAERAVQRFVREMKVSAAVHHPHTVEVYDFGSTDDGSLYLAMELLEGKPLSDLIEAGPLAIERVGRIGAQIARALAAAHAEGVIHRDLKPANVFLLDRYEHVDFVKVLDFGIAKYTDPKNDEEARALTSTGMLVGTPLYLAPEYIAKNQLDHRCDLYALGVVLYQLATGKEPFDGPPGRILSQTVHRPPPSPSRVRGEELPRWLEDAILALLEKEPENRPADAEAAARMLEGGQRAEEPALPKGAEVAVLRRYLPWLVLAVVLLVGAVAAGTFAVAWVVLVGWGG